MNTTDASKLLCAAACLLAAAPAQARRSDMRRSHNHRSYHMVGRTLTMPAPIKALGSQDYQGSTSTTIALAGEDVMRIRTGIAGWTPQQRTEAIRLRLIPIQSIKDLSADDIRVAALPAGERAITVRGRLLATVDRQLAAENNATPAELAGAWVDRLRDTLPQTRVAP